jgi:hypothetical protein
MAIRPSLSLWRYMFVNKYAQLTGMSWEDGGGDDEEIEKYFDLNFTPAEAVEDQICKYDLDCVL